VEALGGSVLEPSSLRCTCFTSDSSRSGEREERKSTDMCRLRFVFREAILILSNSLSRIAIDSEPRSRSRNVPPIPPTGFRLKPAALKPSPIRLRPTPNALSALPPLRDCLRSFCICRPRVFERASIVGELLYVSEVLCEVFVEAGVVGVVVDEEGVARAKEEEFIGVVCAREEGNSRVE